MKIKSVYLKWAGVFSIVLLSAIALTPSAFHIPVEDQPWLFIFNIAWVVMVASGIFQS
jgi:hypothetical protein